MPCANRPAAAADTLRQVETSGLPTAAWRWTWTATGVAAKILERRGEQGRDRAGRQRALGRALGLLDNGMSHTQRRGGLRDRRRLGHPTHPVVL